MPVSSPATMMYRTVQITSDPRMPNGRSFCGFFASCAAVETASKPIYAKKTTLAPRIMPDHPYSPKCPRFFGMNGCQFADMCAGCPKAYTVAMPMKNSTTDTLIITAALLKFADSRTPTTSTVVTTMIAQNAKISTFAENGCPNKFSATEGVGLNGIRMPKYPNRLLT